jgi:CRISPR system Cascade subunit CasB
MIMWQSTTDPETADQGRSPATTVGTIAGTHISQLQHLYRQDKAPAVAELARLRRNVGKPAYSVLDGGGAAGLEELGFSYQAHESGTRELARAEDALYLALTLWAVHQQSIRDANMHQRGESLGVAVRKLAAAQSNSTAINDVSPSLRTRFTRLGTSTSFEALGVRLREIILLLRAHRIPLDYGQLADELNDWLDPHRRADVRRRWGRAFHRPLPRPDGPSPEQPDEEDLDLDPGE